MKPQFLGEYEICNNPLDGRLVVRHYTDNSQIVVRL